VLQVGGCKIIRDPAAQLPYITQSTASLEQTHRHHTSTSQAAMATSPSPPIFSLPLEAHVIMVGLVGDFNDVYYLSLTCKYFYKFLTDARNANHIFCNLGPRIVPAYRRALVAVGACQNNSMCFQPDTNH